MQMKRTDGHPLRNLQTNSWAQATPDQFRYCSTATIIIAFIRIFGVIMLAPHEQFNRISSLIEKWWSQLSVHLSIKSVDFLNNTEIVTFCECPETSTSEQMRLQAQWVWLYPQASQPDRQPCINTIKAWWEIETRASSLFCSVEEDDLKHRSSANALERCIKTAAAKRRVKLECLKPQPRDRAAFLGQVLFSLTRSLSRWMPRIARSSPN